MSELDEIAGRYEEANRVGSDAQFMDVAGEYVEALAAALTEALRERDQALGKLERAMDQRVVLDDHQVCDEWLAEARASFAELSQRYVEHAARMDVAERSHAAALTEAEHRAERAEKVVEAARACDDHGCGPHGSRIFAASQREADRLHDALAALDTTDGPGGTQ